jgi:trimethylamine--corrinoid protein Co-methyltransferase
MPLLSWPDLFVGPGLLGGSMILSLEQIVIDIEIFRMNRQAQRGIPTDDDRWLEDVISKVGPAGNYLGEKSTIRGIRSGSWLVNQLGVHQPLKAWEQAGRPGVLDEAREKVDHILKKHTPLPFSEEIEKELLRVHDRATRSLEG